MRVSIQVLVDTNSPEGILDLGKLFDHMLRFVGEILEVDLLTECSEPDDDMYQVHLESRSLFIYEKTWWSHDPYTRHFVTYMRRCQHEHCNNNYMSHSTARRGR